MVNVELLEHIDVMQRYALRYVGEIHIYVYVLWYGVYCGPQVLPVFLFGTHRHRVCSRSCWLRLQTGRVARDALLANTRYPG